MAAAQLDMQMILMLSLSLKKKYISTVLHIPATSLPKLISLSLLLFRAESINCLELNPAARKKRNSEGTFFRVG